MDFVFRRSYQGPLKAAIFDWAGTTIDFGCVAPAVVFQGLFEARGVAVSMAEAREPMGAHKRAHIAEMMGMERIRQRWEEVHGNPPGNADVDALFAEFVPKQLNAIRDYAELIPGVPEAIAELRGQGLKIGSTSGYTREMMDILKVEGEKRGYAPDCIVAATEVPAARPAPWMAYECMRQLGVYPAEACIKVGDTPKDIQEGLNAGMWSIGVAVSGNEVGLSEAEWNTADAAEKTRRRARAYDRLAASGAHYVVDSIAEVPALLPEITARLARGERP